MNLHKKIEICVKDDNMHIFVMINALLCINNYVITCMNSMLSVFEKDIKLFRKNNNIWSDSYEDLSCGYWCRDAKDSQWVLFR